MFPGRTYTLSDPEGRSDLYYRTIGDLADRFLGSVSSEGDLRRRIRQESKKNRLQGILRRRDPLVGQILVELENALSSFLPGVDRHLKDLSFTDRFDPTMRTSRKQYLLYMLEIELTNRINRESFSGAPWRMALIAHCLRDFRPGCRSMPGDVEEECAGCEQSCHVNTGSWMSRRYGIHPYLSVSMDHRELFEDLQQKHPGLAVLGIACVPELITGMRLCEGLGIPAVGVPLDANRCDRWMGECLETTFSLEELERLMAGDGHEQL